MLASLTCLQHCVTFPRHADNKVLEAAYNLFIKNLLILKAWGSYCSPRSAHFCCAFIFILLLTDILAAVDASPSEKKQGNILCMSSFYRVLQATKNTKIGPAAHPQAMEAFPQGFSHPEHPCEWYSSHPLLPTPDIHQCVKAQGNIIHRGRIPVSAKKNKKKNIAVAGYQ